jgi:hypothetical protein
MNHESTPSTPPKNASLVTIFGLGLIMLLLFWVGTKALVWLSPEVPDAEALRHAERAEIYVKVTEQAVQDLNEYAWRDEAAGQVQIPVERAMELVAVELAANPGVQPANFIDPLRAAAEEGLVTPEPAEAPAQEAVADPAAAEEPAATTEGGAATAEGEAATAEGEAAPEENTSTPEAGSNE